MKKQRSLKFKLTRGVASMFIIMIFMLTLLSLMGVNYFVIDPVQQAIPTALTVPQIGDEALPAQGLTENAEDLLGMAEVVQRAQIQNIGITFLLMTLVGAAGTMMTNFMIGKTLDPLQELSYKIGETNEKVMANPLKVESSISEINELTTSFNTMLQRLNVSFENQQRFSSSAAHELKTPLTAIKTNIEVLEMNNQSSVEEYQKVFAVTKRQISRMSELIDNLLLTASSLEYDANQPISAKVLMQNVLHELQPKIEEKQIQVSLAVDDCIIQGNEVMLNRMLSNLIDNSIKYSSKESCKIDISVKENKNDIQILIADNGIGISENDLALIFEPFYRADKSRSRKVGGSGLGLAIVKDILHQQGGTISFSSELHVGTTVKIDLPKKLIEARVI